MGSIPGLGRSPGVGNGNALQYSCLGNPTDGGAWWATAHGAKRVEHDCAGEYAYMHTHAHTHTQSRKNQEHLSIKHFCF